VPDPETVLRHVGTEHGASGGIEDRCNGQRRSDAHHDACKHEKLGWKPHQEGRLVRRARKADGGRTEEHVANEPERIGNGESACRSDDVGKRLIDK